METTALVTGASSGIGKELATIHAERKGDLVLVARSEAKLKELAAQLERAHGVKVTVIAKDLSQPGAAREVFEHVQSAGITIDMLINNAGFGGRGKFHERTWEDDLSMINLNVVALTALTRFFLPGFVARGSGKILNVSSTAALVPGGPLQAVYYATKAFVTVLSNSLAEELAGTGITVTALMPGATESEFGRTSGMDKTPLFQKTASARSVAQAGYDAMVQGKMDVITGVSFSQRLSLGAAPFLPKKMLLQTIHKMQQTPA